MNLTIDRTKWARGLTPSDSRLLGPQGMCCLGFFCKAKGIDDKQIAGLGYLSQLVKGGLAPQSNFDGLVDERGDNTSLCILLTNVNDASSVVLEGCRKPTSDWTDAQREAKITELFAQIRVSVTFIN